jgi:ATP-dependent Zn protease
MFHYNHFTRFNGNRQQKIIKPIKVCAISHPISYINIQVPQPQYVVSQQPLKNTVLSKLSKFYNFQSLQAPETETFPTLVENDKVLTAMVNPSSHELSYQTIDGDVGKYHWDGMLPSSLIESMKKHDVIFEYDTPTDYPHLVKTIIEITMYVVYLIIACLMIKAFMSQKGGNPLNSFTSAKPAINPEEVTTTFADIAGLDSAKEEIMEVLRFLKVFFCQVVQVLGRHSLQKRLREKQEFHFLQCPHQVL